MKEFSLKDFVNESNYIEDIAMTTEEEITAHEEFLEEDLSVASLEKLVSVLQPGARLRNQFRMDVQVGNHLPPAGGFMIVAKLNDIINGYEVFSPWELHCKYEDLHPFMDGNGRSGRALWLKRMDGIKNAPLGFLHTFYYMTLQERRK